MGPVHMNEEIKRMPVTIRNAVLQFCFGERVEDVQVCERYFTSQQLAEFGYPNLAGASNRGEPKDPGARRLDFQVGLISAWKGLLLDLRERLVRGEIAVTGVRTHPNPTTERTIIPGVWAHDFRIDALNNTVTFRQTRYVAILIGEPECFPEAVPELKQSEGEPTNSTIPPITPENVRGLSDDEVLLLLEDHAQRVIDGPDAKLIAHVKVSVMPIIKRKMQHRAKAGELLDTLAAEAQILADWIETKIPSHQAPGAGAIKNKLRVEYARLRAQSNDMKP